MSKQKITHYKNMRLRNNAGMDIPECKAYATILDCDSGRWPMTSDTDGVTCKNCLRSMKGSWYMRKSSL